MNVSVIIPMLNEQSRISDAVASAREAGAFEVIVCDGGSQDDSVAIATTAGAVVIASPPGRSAQCNTGAAAATGDVLLFLHADCRLHPETIRELTDCLSADENVIAGGFRQRIDDVRCRYRIMESGNALRIRILKWVYGDQALFVRTDVFRRLKGFPALRFMEDFVFSRIAARHGRVVLLNSPVTVSARRWHRRGLIRQTCRNWTLILLALCGVSPDRLARFYPNDR